MLLYPSMGYQMAQQVRWFQGGASGVSGEGPGGGTSVLDQVDHMVVREEKSFLYSMEMPV